MSNSTRIETATRSKVGETLNSSTITELVKKSFPDFTGGVYPSDAAYVRKDGRLVPRGKTAYGDGVLEYVGPNAFKVLPTNEIVRRPGKAAAPAPVPAEVKKAEAAAPAKAGKKKSGKASQPPVAPKIVGRDRVVTH